MLGFAGEHAGVTAAVQLGNSWGNRRGDADHLLFIYWEDAGEMLGGRTLEISKKNIITREFTYQFPYKQRGFFFRPNGRQAGPLGF